MRDLFEREQQILEAANRIIDNMSEETPCDYADYEILSKEYGKLLRQLRRVTKMSDRTALDLNSSKMDLLDKLLRMSSIVESSPNFVAYKKLSGECVYLNPAASMLTGYSHDELMEDYIGVLFDKETADYLRTEISKALFEKSVVHYEVSLKRKDGELRVFSVCSFLVESDEKAFGTIATDVTDRKQAEAEKLKALEKAEQASRAKSDFLSRMSHEMKTPMNAITGMTALAQKAIDMDEAQLCLEKINDAAAHLLGMINDILDMSKLESGATELASEAFTLQDLLSQVNAVMGARFEKKRQTYTVDVTDRTQGVLVADKQKLAQSIMHLLSNAHKFTPECGHIRLSARTSEESSNHHVLEFVVQDDGIGIPEEKQVHLFKAFEQSDNTITRRHGGTGLGLTIAQRFVRLMGGELSVRSKTGEGTIVRFAINVGGNVPDDNERQDMVAPVTGSIENVFAGRHILLAEDVDMNRDILAALLEDTGVVIDCAENGRIAYDKFAANPRRYNMILMDIHMPEMNGYDAAKAIRGVNAAEAKTIPIIAVTADVSDDDINSSGMNGYLAKPLDIDAVIATMKQYLL